MHAQPAIWEKLLSNVSHEHVDLMDVIKEGVDVEQCLTHFKGDFKGKSFDSDRPPTIVLENSRSCAQFSDFISTTILQWVSAGVLSVWGEIGQVSPPYLVLPLTVEPSKPRLCHDERYLNLWIKDLPFKLDHLSDLPRYVLPGHYQKTFDEKSGYQHVYLHPSSRTFFGLYWQGFYFTFCMLPFGWKASAFAVSGAARFFSVPLFQYIDDRHLGQLLVQSSKQPWAPSYQNAVAAAYILCYLLVEACYFVNLSKSQCTPFTFVTFLGFICYSSRQAFLIPEEKKVKFKVLRENVLASKTLTLKTLQRFAKKAVSFSLAIAGCKLYLREIFKAVSGLVRNSKPAIKVTGLLQSELEYWRFLDDWSDCLPWRSEKHITATLYCDPSKRAWGGVLMTDNGRVEAGDYWREDSGSINFLEAKALLCALDAFKSRIRNSRVDVHTDSRALLGSWRSRGGSNTEINDVIKADKGILKIY